MESVGIKANIKQHCSRLLRVEAQSYAKSICGPAPEIENKSLLGWVQIILLQPVGYRREGFGTGKDIQCGLNLHTHNTAALRKIDFGEQPFCLFCGNPLHLYSAYLHKRFVQLVCRLGSPPLPTLRKSLLE